MAAHRYWRLLCHSNASPPYAFSELAGAITAGGANVFTGGTAASSSNYSGFVPSAAFDGNIGTNWAAATGNNPEWISYDLGAGITKDIVEIKITARNDVSYYQAPVTADWQYSDNNATWTTYFPLTASAWASAAQIQTFSFPYKIGEIATEVLLKPLVKAQLSEVAAEILLKPLVSARLGEVGVEVLLKPLVKGRIGSMGVEVLRSSIIANIRRRRSSTC